MKKLKLIISAIFLLTVVTGYCLADEIISRLGMEHRNARHYILSNLVGSFEVGPMEENNEDGGSNADAYDQMKSFRIPYARLLPAVIKGDKAGAARELCTYVKMYINSSDFMDDYTKRREAAKPTTEPWRPDAELIQSQRQSVKEMDKQLADLKKQKGISPDIIAAYEKGILDQKKNLAEWEDPHPNLTRWEKSYPADPAPLVKQKLQDYLTLAATVDFEAALTAPDKYKTVKFVNSAYEKQSLKWKACFRAGKEVNEIITTFVKEWLKGEIISKEKNKMPDFKPAETAPPPTGGPVASAPASTSKTDSIAKPIKEKKSLLNKLKKATGF
jgi:hypothetical protein